MKETEEGTKRWRNIPRSCIGRLNIAKIPVLPRAIYTFSAIPIKIKSFKEIPLCITFRLVFPKVHFIYLFRVDTQCFITFRYIE